MNWQEILTIILPLAGYITWVHRNIEKKAAERQALIDKRFEDIEKRFENVDRRFDKIQDGLQTMNIRLTRLEGRFDERGYWEARELRKTGTEEK